MGTKAQIFEALLSSQRASGVTLSGGKVYFYTPGTTSLKTVYSDRNKTIAANPFTLDSNGQARLYGDGLYDIQVKNSTLSVSLPLWEDVQLTDGSENLTWITEYTSLENAVSIIGSTKTTLLYGTDQSIVDSLAIPATLELKPINGAIITTPSSKTLTINSAAKDISIAGAGNVVFGSNAEYTSATIANTGTITFNVKPDLGLYNIFTGGVVPTFPTSFTSIHPEWWGAVGNDSTDSTAAFAKAITAANKIRTIILNGIYSVTATAGNYAVTLNTAMKGSSPQLNGIHNVGGGSALLIQGANYYTRWENFSVIGNASSQHGIVTNITGTTFETSYSSFKSVDSYNHGGHGLLHRNSWATRYIDCKFYNNSGLGVFLNTPGAPPTDLGTHNDVTFINCDSRHNGGTSTATTYADDKGGVKIVGGAGVYWLGGIVESNNAWGFIIAPPLGGQATRSIHLSPTYMEYNPMYATIGGNFYTSGPWSNITVSKAWLAYGGPGAGQTGYNFYVTGGESATGGNSFKEYDNTSIAVGPGTKVLYFGASQTPPKKYYSVAFGDLLLTNTPSTTTLVTISGTTPRVQITGFLTVKRETDAVGAVYPFTAMQDGTVTKSVVLGAVIAGTVATPPTMAFSSDNLQVSLAGNQRAMVEITDASNYRPSDYALTYNPLLFGYIMNRE